MLKSKKTRIEIVAEISILLFSFRLVKIQENKDWNKISVTSYLWKPLLLKSKKTRIEIISKSFSDLPIYSR